MIIAATPAPAKTFTAPTKAATTTAAPAATAAKPTVTKQPSATGAAPGGVAAAAAAAAKSGDVKKFSAPKKDTKQVAPGPAPTPAGGAGGSAAAAGKKVEVKKATTAIAPGKLPEKPKAVVKPVKPAGEDEDWGGDLKNDLKKPEPAKVEAPKPVAAASAPAAGVKKFAAPTKAGATAAPAKTEEPKPTPSPSPPPEKSITRVPSNNAVAESTYKPATVQRVAAPVAARRSAPKDQGDKPSFLTAARVKGWGKRSTEKKAPKEAPKPAGKDNVMV